MMVKSTTRGDHFEALDRFLARVEKYNLRLNPKKCIFGVTSGKLLGHIVSQKGIEVDPDKVKAIQDMPVPKTEKEVRGFLGKIQYISRFISKLTTIYEPIFKVLRKGQKVEWDEQCQKLFDTIKQYLMNSPVLQPPRAGRPLILYLALEEDAIGPMVAQENEEGIEYAVYYLSKKLLPYEAKYDIVQKTCLAVIWTT